MRNEIEALAVSPRLYKELKDLQYKNEEKDKEIERLKDAINEIEAIVYANISNIDARISIQEVLDKLKELKGSDK